MGTRACSKCGQERPHADFQHFKGKPSGQCRACKTKAEKARRERVGIAPRKLSRVAEGKKLCTCCGKWVELAGFSPSIRGLAGVSAYCKACTAERARARKGAAAKTTAAYRKRHPERHKANHRVRMFEYRTRKKVTSDGTVTDEVLARLYGQPECHYCGEKTPDALRTVDHKTPLARGGEHTAANLVMACRACNSSKRDMTEEEFFQRIKNADHSHSY